LPCRAANKAVGGAVSAETGPAAGVVWSGTANRFFERP
jgi:hypothetical protein